MKIPEILLTNIPRILELKELDLTYEEIAVELNNELNLNISSQQIRNILQRLKSNQFHKKYNNFFIFSVEEDFEGEFVRNGIISHDLFISSIAITRLFKLEHLALTPKNFMQKLKTEEGIIYAKRLLKQYNISDERLLDYLRQTYPSNKQINYKTLITELHENLDNETYEWVQTLKKYAVNLTKNKKEI